MDEGLEVGFVAFRKEENGGKAFSWVIEQRVNVALGMKVTFPGYSVFELERLFGLSSLY